VNATLDAEAGPRPCNYPQLQTLNNGGDPMVLAFDDVLDVGGPGSPWYL
jgi:hypothetical protein